MSTIIFTPSSLEDFKRTARDLQTASDKPLQECQNALAKGYGYLDLHALQEHLKTKPKPGPFHDEVNDYEMGILLRMKVPNEVYGLLKPQSWGRMSIEEIGLCERPAVRSALMAEQRAIDALLAGNGIPEPDTPTTAYLQFDHDLNGKEGVLRRTAKSNIVHAALSHLLDLEDGTRRMHNTKAAEIQLDAIFSTREDIANVHPNSPYALAGLLMPAFESWNDQVPEGAAKALWPDLQRCREMFERVVPKAFRQSIEPKLVGRGADNFPYLQVLWAGATCAEVLGLRTEALAWARKGRALNKNDNFGFRFVISRLK